VGASLAQSHARSDRVGGRSFEQFVRALRQSQRPDGTALRAPMTFIAPFAQQMTDVELQALWAYLQSLPPVPVVKQN